MKQIRVSTVSPQAKMIALNEALGNVGLKHMQGTTREIYDQLPLDGPTNFQFFKTVSTREFPQTNFDGMNNRMGVGEAMIFERAHLAIVTVDAGDQNDFVSVIPISGAGFPDIVGGIISCTIANQVVIKPIGIASFIAPLNISSNHVEHTVYEFDTMICLPPVVEFSWLVETATATIIANTELRLTLAGSGAILNVRGPL